MTSTWPRRSRSLAYFNILDVSHVYVSAVDLERSTLNSVFKTDGKQMPAMPSIQYTLSWAWVQVRPRIEWIAWNQNSSHRPKSSASVAEVNSDIVFFRPPNSKAVADRSCSKPSDTSFFATRDKSLCTQRLVDTKAANVYRSLQSRNLVPHIG